jgi:transposase
MEGKSKSILGQRIGKSVYFSDEEKRQIVEEYLSGTASRSAVFVKYTGHDADHGAISRWMLKFGYSDNGRKKESIFTTMSKKKHSISSETESFESMQLKKRILELEKQLKEAEMKAIAFSTMVDIAEKQFNIPIRKKYNTKS